MDSSSVEGSREPVSCRGRRRDLYRVFCNRSPRQEWLNGGR